MENIYKKIAYSITNIFIRNEIISNESKSIYLYGFEILLSTFMYTFIFVLTAFISNTIKISLVFWIGFYILRTLAGGYHAKTYIKCHILFFINHIVFIIVFYSFPKQTRSLMTLIMIIISTIIVLLLSPIDNPNKPFINKEKQKFKALSNLYIIIVLIASIILYCSFPNILIDYSMSFAIGTLSAAISLLSAKILNDKEVR